MGEHGGRFGGVAVAGLDGSRLLRAGLLVAPLVILIAAVALTPSTGLAYAGSDLRVYLDDSSRLLSGAVPYRDFPFEYPPLALVPMALAHLAWPFGTPSSEAFAWTFTLVQGLLAIVAGWLIGSVADRPLAARATWAALVLVVCASVAWRFDLWPAVSVLVAVVAAQRGRPGAAGIALGIGAMTKAFPVVVVPVLAARSIALRDWAGLARLLLGTAAIIGIVMAASFVGAGGDAFQWVAYLANRGLQLESTAAGLLLALHVIAGQPVSLEFAFQSLQIASPAAGPLAMAAPYAELFAVSVVCAVSLVGFRREVAHQGRVSLTSLAGACVAVVVATIVTSKVFSVQYVVWFLPLVPLLPRPQRLLAAAGVALSAVIYPIDYQGLWQLEPPMIFVLNVRNLLLVALLAWLALGLLRPSVRPETPSRSPRESSSGGWRPA